MPLGQPHPRRRRPREDLALIEGALQGGEQRPEHRWEQAQGQENTQSLQVSADVVDELCNIVLSVLFSCHWTPPMSQAVIFK